MVEPRAPIKGKQNGILYESSRLLVHNLDERPEECRATKEHIATGNAACSASVLSPRPAGTKHAHFPISNNSLVSGDASAFPLPTDLQVSDDVPLECLRGRESGQSTLGKPCSSLDGTNNVARVTEPSQNVPITTDATTCSDCNISSEAWVEDYLQISIDSSYETEDEESENSLEDKYEEFESDEECYKPSEVDHPERGARSLPQGSFFTFSVDLQSEEKVTKPEPRVVRSILKNAGSSSDSLPPENSVHFLIQNIDFDLYHWAEEYLAYLITVDRSHSDGPSSNAGIIAQLRAAIHSAEAGMRSALDYTTPRNVMRAHIEGYAIWKLYHIGKAAEQSGPENDERTVERIGRKCKFDNFLQCHMYAPEEEEEGTEEMNSENSQGSDNSAHQQSVENCVQVPILTHRQPLGVIKAPTAADQAKRVVNNEAHEICHVTRVITEIQSSSAIPVTRGQENSTQHCRVSEPPEVLTPRVQSFDQQDEYDRIQSAAYSDATNWQTIPVPDADLLNSPPSSPTFYTTCEINDCKKIQAEENEQKCKKKSMLYERPNVPKSEPRIGLPSPRTSGGALKTPLKNDRRAGFRFSKDNVSRDVSGMAANRARGGPNFDIQTNAIGAVEDQISSVSYDVDVNENLEGHDFTECSNEEDDEFEIQTDQNVKRPSFTVWRD